MLRQQQRLISIGGLSGVPLGKEEKLIWLLR